MRPFSAAWLSLVSLAVSSPIDNAAKTGSSSVLKPETLAHIQNITETLGIPGGFVAFTSPKGDGVLTFGNRTVNGDPVTPTTHFALASNSKLFLGTILAWLAEKKTRLDNGATYTLETPLKDFVPNFKMWDENATESASTLDFLAHRTGLPQHNFAINPSDTPQTWMERIAFLRPNSEFRSKLTYSNVNYAAITYVVELLTKKTYWEVLDEYIFQPLGMEASSDYAALKSSGAEISQGWLRQGTNYTLCAADLATAPPGTLPPSCAGELAGFEFWTEGTGQEWGGGGNVIATGNDLVLWSKEILNPSHIPLSVFERVETPPFPSAGGAGYAFGTVQSPYRGYNMSLHDGALPGSNSFFARIRNESIGVFTLATDDSLAMTWYDLVRPLVLDDLLGLEPEQAETPGGAEGDPTAGAPSMTPPPESPRPSPELDAFIGGSFVAPGYSPFTISSVDLGDANAIAAAGIPIDFLRSDIATLQGLDYSQGQLLFSAWNQTVATYLVFKHFDGPLYNTTILYTRQPLDGGMTLGKYFGSATAVFTDGGIGFFDGFWSSPSTPGNLPAVEEGVEEAAEVYFARQ